MISIGGFVKMTDGCAEILGISCYYNLLPLVVLAIEEIKKQNPELTVVLGGPGPTAVCKELMENFNFIDIIVRGEGERTILELINTLINKQKPLSKVKGILYRDKEGVHCNAPRERIENLDEIPFPAYYKIEERRHAYKEFGVITSRGCPYNCAFCQVSALWGRYNTRRSIENVIEEVALLYERYKVKRINIFDDLFTLDKKRVLKFCAKLKEQHLDIEWTCLSRVDTVDEEMLKRMAESGCSAIQYGVESGCNKILRLIGKNYTKEKAEKTVRKSLKYMKMVVANFIWGFPFETMEDFFETIFFMSKLAKMGCIIEPHILAPCSLSRLYSEYGKSIAFDERLCRDTTWEKYSKQDKHRIVGLIRKYPHIFSDFYYYVSDTILQKYNMLNQAGWSFVRMGSLVKNEDPNFCSFLKRNRDNFNESNCLGDEG
jgi:radical SAM superfamily enzyme YgiQ (UPF0313 family)